MSWKGGAVSLAITTFTFTSFHLSCECYALMDNMAFHVTCVVDVRSLEFLISVETLGYIGKTGFAMGFTLAVAENIGTLTIFKHKQCVI